MTGTDNLSGEDAALARQKLVAELAAQRLMKYANDHGKPSTWHIIGRFARLASSDAFVKLRDKVESGKAGRAFSRWREICLGAYDSALTQCDAALYAKEQVLSALTASPSDEVLARRANRLFTLACNDRLKSYVIAQGKGKIVADEVLLRKKLVAGFFWGTYAQRYGINPEL